MLQTTNAYTLNRKRLMAGARGSRTRLRCSLEGCVDSAAQRWEPQAIMLHRDAEGVVDAITQWLLRDAAPTGACGATRAACADGRRM